MIDCVQLIEVETEYIFILKFNFKKSGFIYLFGNTRIYIGNIYWAPKFIFY